MRLAYAPQNLSMDQIDKASALDFGAEAVLSSSHCSEENNGLSRQMPHSNCISPLELQARIAEWTAFELHKSLGARKASSATKS